MPKEWFKLSEHTIKHLTYYYMILLLLGFIIVISSLLYGTIREEYGLSVTIVSIIGGIGTALLGSTIFYLRKLYKSCINEDFSEPITKEDKIKAYGVYAYFFLRPLFAIAFSLLIHIALKSSVHIVTVKEARLNEGFIYLTMFLSFFGGFASGDLIDYIESKSNELVTKVFNRH